jgi:hypothetical protein
VERIRLGASRLKESGRRGLVAEAGADRDALAADGAAAAQHGGASLGLHARTETVSLHALAAIGLECALGHEKFLLFSDENLRLDGKY